MSVATVKEVMAFFDIKAAQFMKEWKELSAEAKEQLKEGIGNGTFTY